MVVSQSLINHIKNSMNDELHWLSGLQFTYQGGGGMYLWGNRAYIIGNPTLESSNGLGRCSGACREPLSRLGQYSGRRK